MAVSSQSRRPEQAAARRSSGALGDNASSEAELSLRLCVGSDGAEPDSSLWESDLPAVCLILDLIAASEGVIQASREGLLVAAFPTFQAAILTARRLQWAMQGFSEAEDQQAASLALLVHAPDEERDASSLLETATPGAILLTEKASQPLENLPGLPLRAATGNGLRELEWRGPQSQSTRAFDEEILDRMIAEQGAQHSSPEHPPLPSDAERTENFATTVQTGNIVQLPPKAARKSAWWLGGAAVAALALVAVGFYLFHGKLFLDPDRDQKQSAHQLAPPPAAPTSPPVEQGVQQQSAAPAQTTRSEAPAAAPAAKSAPKAAVKSPAAESMPEKMPAPRAAEPQSAKNSQCDLDPGQYAGEIDQASRNLARGKYADAKREFSAVLACDPGNARAREGLERARMAANSAEGHYEN
jgi:hypothetical protein